MSNIESDKSKPTIEQLSKMIEIYEIDIIELLSKKGITFNQNNQEGSNNGIVHHHYPEKLIESYEIRMEEQEKTILLLKEEIENLKK